MREGCHERPGMSTSTLIILRLEEVLPQASRVQCQNRAFMTHFLIPMIPVACVSQNPIAK